MIATERFVFVHMHKTGGQTINEIIGNYFIHHQVIGYHYPYSLLPEQFAKLPLVGFVRNPWDWYVSWYAFNRRPNIQNALFSIYSNGGKADFKTTVTNLINLGEDTLCSQQYRDALVSVLPENLQGNRAVGLSKDCIRDFNDKDTGYYSWLFDRMIGGAGKERVYIGSFENLQTDFLDILEKLEVPEISKVAHALSRSEYVNSSRHSHYSHYYDRELEELILHKEQSLIGQFDYEFERDKSADDVISLPNTYANNDTFKKLLNKADNFLLLKDNYDVNPLTNKLQKISESQWTQSGREQRYTAHNQTQSLLLIHDEDMRHRNPSHHDLYDLFEPELKSVLGLIANYYQNDGYIIRLLFTRLLPGDVIPPPHRRHLFPFTLP